MKRKAFWIVIFINLLLTLTDGLLTYIGTPDLRFESNPLISFFGLGWSSLILSNILWFAFFALCAYFTLVKYQSPRFNVNSFQEYISMLFYNRPDKFIWSWYRLPKNWKPYLSAGGFAFMLTLPITRLIAILEWTFRLTHSPLDSLVSSLSMQLPFYRLDLLVAVMVVLFSFSFWMVKEYNRNKKELKRQVSFE